jgi:hypothetical protein
MLQHGRGEAFFPCSRTRASTIRSENSSITPLPMHEEKGSFDCAIGPHSRANHFAQDDILYEVVLVPTTYAAARVEIINSNSRN